MILMKCFFFVLYLKNIQYAMFYGASEFFQDLCRWDKTSSVSNKYFCSSGNFCGDCSVPSGSPSNIPTKPMSPSNIPTMSQTNIISGSPSNTPTETTMSPTVSPTNEEDKWTLSYYIDSDGRQYFPKIPIYPEGSFPYQPIPNCASKHKYAGCVAIPSSIIQTTDDPYWAGKIHAMPPSCDEKKGIAINKYPCQKYTFLQ